MITLTLLLLILAFVLAVLALFKVAPNYDLTAAAVLLVVIALLLGQVS